MKPQTLLVLTLLLAALGAFVWFYERKLPSTDERAERAKNVLALKPADVTAVDIAWDGQQVRLEREPAPVKTERLAGGSRRRRRCGGSLRRSRPPPTGPRSTAWSNR